MNIGDLLKNYAYWIDVEKKSFCVSRHIYDNIEITPLIITLFSGEDSADTRCSLSFRNCDVEFCIEPYRNDIEKLLIRFKDGYEKILYCVNAISQH